MGLFQVAPDLQTRLQGEFRMFERGAELGCHVMYSGGAGPNGDGGVARTAEFLERSNEGGRRMTGICPHATERRDVRPRAGDPLPQHPLEGVDGTAHHRGPRWRR